MLLYALFVLQSVTTVRRCRSELERKENAGQDFSPSSINEKRVSSDKRSCKSSESLERGLHEALLFHVDMARVEGAATGNCRPYLVQHEVVSPVALVHSKLP